MHVRLATLLLIASLTPSLADEIRITGVRSSRDVACEKGQGVIITGTDHRLAIRGDCGAVEIYGSAHHVSFETAASLQIGGFDNRVSGRQTGQLTVDGRDNKVETAIMPPADGAAAVEVSGLRHGLALKLTGASRIIVHGKGSEIGWTAEPGVAAPQAEMSGTDNRIVRR